MLDREEYSRLPPWIIRPDYILAEALMAFVMVWDAFDFLFGADKPPPETPLSFFIWAWPGLGWAMTCFIVAIMHIVGLLLAIFWPAHRRVSYVLRIPAVTLTSSYVLTLGLVQFSIHKVALPVPVLFALGVRGVWTLVRIGYLVGLPPRGPRE